MSFEYYEISRVFRSLGIFGLIMLFYKSGWFNWLFALARPVGQMAFTNYLDAIIGVRCIFLWNWIGHVLQATALRNILRGRSSLDH